MQIRSRKLLRLAQRGQTVVLTAIAFPAILIISVLVLDFARIHMVQQEVQNAADAAALAGASQAQKIDVYRCLQVQKPNPLGSNKPPILYSQAVKWGYFYKLNPTAAYSAAQQTLDANLTQMGLYNATTNQYTTTFNAQRLALDYAWPFYNAKGVTPAPVAATQLDAAPGLLDPVNYPPGDRTTQIPVATGFEVQVAVTYQTLLLGIFQHHYQTLNIVRHSVSQLYYNANAATAHPQLPNNGTWTSPPTINPDACGA